MFTSLYPVPRSVRVEPALLDLRDSRWLRVAPELSAALKAQALAFAAEAAPAFRGPLQVTAAAPAAGACFLTIAAPRGRGPAQGYRLSAAPAGLRLEGTDEAGLFYGLQTLRQIVAERGALLPAFAIEDAPVFAQRGIMLDISRCKVPTLATLFQLVDRLAALKINHLELYTEHTFAYSAHDRVWHDASPVTPQEILALDAYCRERFIELVPNQNSFGHFERWLRYPEYRHLAECPDGHEWPWGGRATCGSTLAPRPTSLAFLKSLYAELLPNFSSGLFNVGCDETWELGQGWSKARCAKRGKTRVYLDFLLEIRRLVKGHRRQMMFWGDIILHQPELIRELNPDMIALEWGYEANHPFAEHCPLFAASGIPFYVCPGTSSWNSITGRTRNCLGNLANAAENGEKHGALGFLNTDWGDGGHHQYLPISYLGFAAGAAYSWGFKANAGADVAGALNRTFFADPTGVLGRLCHELGDVLELVKGRPGNSTVFNRLLFWDLDPKGIGFDGITPAMLRRCVTRFAELEEQAADARPAAADGALARAELLNAIAMARHGTQRALAVLAPESAPGRSALRRDLCEIIGRHSDLWLARNRPGGLHESSQRLRSALDALA
jgi:hypothetical protein